MFISISLVYFKELVGLVAEFAAFCIWSLCLGILPAGRGCSWMQDYTICHSRLASNEWRQGPLYSVFRTAPAEVSSVLDLLEFICSGPLLDKLGLTKENVAESIDKWLQYGLQLCRLFQLNEFKLTVPQKARFYHYYIPVFLWCEDQISRHNSLFKDGQEIPPLVVHYTVQNLPLSVFSYSSCFSFK